MALPLIEVSGVCKSFGRQKVLHDVSFQVNRGEILGLLGPNGSGKTTLIRLINGVIEPDGGKIQVAGFDSWQDGDRVRRMSGVLTEGAGLYEELSGLDNLLFFAEIYGVQDKKRIGDLLEEFGLSEHRHKKVGAYSTGMKKRLSLMKALLHQPDILFLDEPTNGLDPEGIRGVIAYIKALNQRSGTTVLLCSHVLQQIESLCRRYVFIEDGKVIEQGTLKAIENKYLREIRLKVETDYRGEGNSYQGYTFERLSPDTLLFILPGKNAIPGLLRGLAGEAAVYSAEITNRDLETLYFIVGESR